MPRLASHDELEAVRDIVAEYKTYWEAKRPLFPRAFEGDPADLDALEYLAYEIGLPRSDLWGAALIWGGVLVANAPFRWYLDDAGGFVLGLLEDPTVWIWPYARLSEATAFGRFRRVFEEVVFACLVGGRLEEADEHRLLGLLRKRDAEEYLDRIESASDRLRDYLTKAGRRADRHRGRLRKGRG